MASTGRHARRLVFGMLGACALVLGTGVGTAVADSQPQPIVKFTPSSSSNGSSPSSGISAAAAQQQAQMYLAAARANEAALPPNIRALLHDAKFEGWLVSFLQSGGTNFSSYTSMFQAASNAFNKDVNGALKTNPQLSAAAGAISAAGGGCMDPISAAANLPDSTSISVSGTTAHATIRVPKDLCGSLDVALTAFKKVGDIPWPGPQVLQDYKIVTVKSAGTYNLSADLPTSMITTKQAAAVGADECTEVGGVQVANPAQVDVLASMSSLGEGGSLSSMAAKGNVNQAGLYPLAGLQTDVHTDGGLSQQAVPSNLSLVGQATPTEQAKIKSLVDEACVAGIQQTKVEGATALPNTGSDPLPLTIAGIALIICGWIALCFKSVAPKRT